MCWLLGLPARAIGSRCLRTDARDGIIGLHSQGFENVLMGSPPGFCRMKDDATLRERSEVVGNPFQMRQREATKQAIVVLSCPGDHFGDPRVLLKEPWRRSQSKRCRQRGEDRRPLAMPKPILSGV